METNGFTPCVYLSLYLTVTTIPYKVKVLFVVLHSCFTLHTYFSSCSGVQHDTFLRDQSGSQQLGHKLKICEQMCTYIFASAESLSFCPFLRMWITYIKFVWRWQRATVTLNFILNTNHMYHACEYADVPGKWKLVWFSSSLSIKWRPIRYHFERVSPARKEATWYSAEF